MDNGVECPVTWRCLVCQKPSTQIHVLPCQHKFCKHCLELWAGVYLDMYHGCDGEFPCQICWKLYSVPSQGICAFEQDFQIDALQQGFSDMVVDNTGTQLNQTGPFSYSGSQFGMQPEIAVTADAAMKDSAILQTGEEMQQQQACMDEGSAYRQQEYNVSSRVVDEGSAYMQQEYNVSSRVVAVPSTSQDGQAGSTTVYPTSMVSHMVPHTLHPSVTSVDSEQRRQASPGYCVRSCHLYSHFC